MRPVHGSGPYSVFFLFRHLKKPVFEDEPVLGGGSCQLKGHYSRFQGKRKRDDSFRAAKEVWISPRDQLEPFK